MANNWNIPDWLEKKVRNRDKRCVYCHTIFRNNSRDKVTWEHIDNDESNICEGNITLCCNSCNASKGSKMLQEWLGSIYCKKKKINIKTVASVVKNYVKGGRNRIS